MPSHVDWVRNFCLSLPHTTEDIQWGNDLLFRLAGKIYCVVPLDPQVAVKLSCKCTPEKFAELVEIEGIIPAPYMARNHWVAFVDLNGLRQNEVKELISNSYRLVFAGLSKILQAKLGEKPTSKSKKASKKR